ADLKLKRAAILAHTVETDRILEQPLTPLRLPRPDLHVEEPGRRLAEVAQQHMVEKGLFLADEHVHRRPVRVEEGCLAADVLPEAINILHDGGPLEQGFDLGEAHHGSNVPRCSMW